MKDNVTIAL